MQTECLQCIPADAADWKTVLAIISALSALAAIVIGPMAAYKIAVRQIRISTDATERKEWLNGFRDDIATFLAKAEIVSLLTRGVTNAKLLGDATAHGEALGVLFRKIGLRLDPIKPSHLEVLNLLEKVLAHSYQPSTITPSDFMKLTRQTNDQARHLILVELDEIRGFESSRTLRHKT